MKTKRKLKYCLNCYEELTLEDNYCPCCGQENQDQKVSLPVFVRDFFNNFLSFDSSLYRTLPAFLLKPGKLTIEFNEGKRRKYLHPIRLYLIFSLFYFFVISLVIPTNFFDRIMATDIKNLGDFNDPEIQSKIKDIPEDDRKTLDSIFHKANITSFSPTVKDTVPIQKNNWKQIKAIAQDDDITDEEFSMALNNTTWDLNILNISTEKKRRFIANSNLYVNNSARNLPLMMFILLPFFALILKILYIRHSKYYVEHLIHSLNLHSFAYLIYGIGILLLHFELGNPWDIIWLSFTIVTLYAFLSLKRIHEGGWFKTFFKFSLLGFIYLNILSMGLFFELYISLLLL